MPRTLTLKEAVPQFLEHLRQAGKIERTVKVYGNALHVAMGFFGEEKALTSFAPAAVGRFLKSDALLRKPSGKERAHPTVDQIVRCVRMLFEWAVAEGHIETMPFPKAAMPKRGRKAKEGE